MRRRYSLVEALLEADELEKVSDSGVQAQLTRAQNVMKVLLPKAVRAFIDLYTAEQLRKFIADVADDNYDDDQRSGIDEFVAAFREALDSDSGRIFVIASSRVLEPAVSDMSAYMGSRLRGMWLSDAISEFLLGDSGFPIVLFNPIIKYIEEDVEIDYDAMARGAIYALTENVADTVLRKEMKLGSSESFREQVVAKSHEIKDMLEAPIQV